jgi:eukaryotic-like serine/threonine-protein kinase
MNWLRAILYCVVFVLVFLISGYGTMKVLIREEGTTPCPDTVGKELPEAKRIADAKGLSVVVSRYEKRKDVPYNYIISQRPEPSMPVRKGRVVTVVVSEGPLLVNVPQLTGHPLQNAEEALKERYIPLKQVLQVPSSNVGLVVAQSPRSGRNIVDEEGMTLFAGTRPKRYYIMPDIVGKPAPEVLSELDAKQIKYKITYVERPGRQARTIVETSVPPRVVIGEDDTIDIKAVGG